MPAWKRLRRKLVTAAPRDAPSQRLVITSSAKRPTRPENAFASVPITAVAPAVLNASGRPLRVASLVLAVPHASKSTSERGSVQPPSANARSISVPPSSSFLSGSRIRGRGASSSR